jgi:acyl-CoA synthetase (AMP-forming)/AMP-acid ligase II
MADDLSPTGALTDDTVFAPIAPTVPIRDGEPYARHELLHEIFEATCRQHPTRRALRFLAPELDRTRRAEISYAELEDRALRFAHHLATLGVTRGDRVVLCLPRGLDQYMAILGILWAGT